MDIKEFSDHFQAFSDNLRKETIAVIVNDRGEFIDYVQEQLYSGINGREKPLRPTYLTDPYFKETYGAYWREEAERYMRWKYSITTPVPSYLGFEPRNKQTPNLIITGEFYSSIYAVGNADGLSIGTRGTNFGFDIERKYGSVIFGISSTARKFYATYTLYTELSNIYKKYMQ